MARSVASYIFSSQSEKKRDNNNNIVAHMPTVLMYTYMFYENAFSVVRRRSCHVRLQ